MNLDCMLQEEGGGAHVGVVVLGVVDGHDLAGDEGFQGAGGTVKEGDGGPYI
jgi:hypothetical protein